MEEERLTVKEIARLAGISIGTVDRVLHHRGGVSADTTERVNEIIAALGYEPNILARQLSLNKSYTFRVILPRSDQDSGYWSLCLEGVRKAERDLAPYRAVVRVDEFDRYDRTAYRKLLKNLIADPCDGLLIAPVLPDELLPVLDSLGDAQRVGGPVPYAFFDADIEGTSPVVAISQDAFRGGYLAGRIMSLLAPRGRPLVALSAYAGDRHIKQRIEGFNAYFRDSGMAAGGKNKASGAVPVQVEAVECLGFEETEERDHFLEGLFRQRPDIGGVLVANSSGHLVGDWLAERGIKGDCAVVSWDLVPDNVRSLREGKIDCVVSQRPSEQARMSLERLFRVAVGREPGSAPAPIPLEVYFKENIPR